MCTKNHRAKAVIPYKDKFLHMAVQQRRGFKLNKKQALACFLFTVFTQCYDILWCKL